MHILAIFEREKYTVHIRDHSTDHRKEHHDSHTFLYYNKTKTQAIIIDVFVQSLLN